MADPALLTRTTMVRSETEARALDRSLTFWPARQPARAAPLGAGFPAPQEVALGHHADQLAGLVDHRQAAEEIARADDGMSQFDGRQRALRVSAPGPP